MKKPNLSKLSLTAAIIACATAANAEITLDAQNNVTAGALSITADGTAAINGTTLKKCDGTTGVTKAKLGTVDCEDTFVILKDKKGNTLSRFSSYALSTDAKGNTERKLYDESLAKLGSATSGASVLDQTQTTTVEETKTVTTEKMAPPAGYINRPVIQAPKVDQTLYTPKLGAIAEKAPEDTGKNTPQDTKLDREIRKTELQARTAPPGSTVPLPASVNQPPVVVDTQTSTPVVQTQTVTNIIKPTPDAAKAGAQASTTTQTDTQAVTPGLGDNAASAVISIPGSNQ